MDPTIFRNGKRIWIIDPCAIEQHRRDLSFAVEKAQKDFEEPVIIRLLPGTHLLHSSDPLNAPKGMFISRSISIEAAVPGTATIFGRPAQVGEPVISVRNTDFGVRDFTLSGVEIDANLIPDTYEDGRLDCLRVEAGKRGTSTVARIRNCIMRKAGGGICAAAHTVSGPELNNDKDLLVSVYNTIIEDMIDNRQELSEVRESHSSAQGVFHDGGTLRMSKVRMRRIGWVPGSRYYIRSNKSHGLYSVRGIRHITNCLAEDCSHNGFAYRDGETISIGNCSIRCPMGFAAGHLNTPWTAKVFSRNDRVCDASHTITKAEDGSPLYNVTTGFSIDMAESVDISNFSAWNVTGRGDWAAFHLRRLSDATGSKITKLNVDIPTMDLKRWSKALHVDPISTKVPGVDALVAAFG